MGRPVVQRSPCPTRRLERRMTIEQRGSKRGPRVKGSNNSNRPFHDLPAGQVAQPTRFLMNQVVVKTADGWKGVKHRPDPGTAAIGD